MEKILIYYSYAYDNGENLNLEEKPEDQSIQEFLGEWQNLHKSLKLIEAYSVKSLHEIYGNINNFTVNTTYYK